MKSDTTRKFIEFTVEKRETITIRRSRKIVDRGGGLHGAETVEPSKGEQRADQLVKASEVDLDEPDDENYSD